MKGHAGVFVHFYKLYSQYIQSHIKATPTLGSAQDALISTTWLYCAMSNLATDKLFLHGEIHKTLNHEGDRDI